MKDAQNFEARMIKPGDGAAIAALWQRFLPPVEGLATWLPQVLDDLLAKKMTQGGVIQRSGEMPLGFGLSCFLPTDVVEGFVAAPEPYFNLRLLEAHRAGKGVLLSPQAQIPYNTGAGLELFVLEYCQVTFDFEDALAHEILNAVVPLYHASHAGFNIRRALHETEVAVGHIQEAGGNAKQFDVTPQHPHSLSEHGLGPRAVYGISRDAMDDLPPTAIAKVLMYCTAPEFQFTLREQEVLAKAFEGKTDQEIATALRITRDGVRARWDTIHAHIEDVKPGFFDSAETGKTEATRGRERKRAILSYLESRPQDLRPQTTRRGSSTA